MTDPPDQDPEHGDGDGLRANETRPHRRNTRPHQSRSSMSTLTPQPPNPVGDGGHEPPSGWYDFLWRVSGDNRRALWFLVFTLVFVGAFLGAVWLVGPLLGTFATSAVGALGGGAAVGAVGGVRKAVRSRRRRTGR